MNVFIASYMSELKIYDATNCCILPCNNMEPLWEDLSQDLPHFPIANQ